jgi:thymidylate synthase (FAD)
MKVINASYEILTPINQFEICSFLEGIGRVCYKSERKITENSNTKFIANLISNGHEAIIEHFSVTVKFICDRGVSHEIVRHRIASYAQESTRYCNYSTERFGNNIAFIKPCFWKETSVEYLLWEDSCIKDEDTYYALLEQGATAQEARSVLPNSLKTELVVTMNLREWRHFFTLRCNINAHPQMRELTLPLLKEFKEVLPIIFNDIYKE